MSKHMRLISKLCLLKVALDVGIFDFLLIMHWSPAHCCLLCAPLDSSPDIWIFIQEIFPTLSLYLRWSSSSWWMQPSTCNPKESFTRWSVLVQLDPDENVKNRLWLWQLLKGEASLFLLWYDIWHLLLIHLSVAEIMPFIFKLNFHHHFSVFCLHWSVQFFPFPCWCVY